MNSKHKKEISVCHYQLSKNDEWGHDSLKLLNDFCN